METFGAGIHRSLVENYPPPPPPPPSPPPNGSVMRGVEVSFVDNLNKLFDKIDDLPAV